MKPIVPEVLAPTVVLAKDQPEYHPIIAAHVTHASYSMAGGRNTMLMAFEPTPEERQRIANGENIYVALLVYGMPMQPIMVMCGKEEAARVYNIKPVTL